MARRSKIRTATTVAPAPSLAARGGTYRPIAKADAQAIAEAAIDMLCDIGVSAAPPSVIDLIVAAGGHHDGTRLRYGRAHVHDSLRSCVKEFALCGQTPRHDLTVGGNHVHVGTGGAAPNILDPTSGDYRPSTLCDLHDAARLADALPHLQFFARSLVAGDVVPLSAFDLNTAYAALRGTSKHVITQVTHPDHLPEIAELCHAIAGSEAAFRARPFVSLNINHVVPPLRLHDQSCEVMIAAVRAGFPVHCNVFGQLGASSPVTLAGSVAQTLAEALAGLALVHAADPAAKATLGPRPMITDLRTGGFSGGSGEQALATAMAVQVLRLWGVPSTVIAGATDSKLPDVQAGYEKALTVNTALQAGANLITQAAGTQAGLMGISFEACVIDNDMLGAVLRANIPPEVTAETLARSMVAEVVAGEGHFLGRAETYDRMRSDFLYPQVADRRSIEEWRDTGRQGINDAARAEADRLLQSHFPDHLEPALRAALHVRFDLRLAD